MSVLLYVFLLELVGLLVHSMVMWVRAKVSLSDPLRACGVKLLCHMLMKAHSQGRPYPQPLHSDWEDQDGRGLPLPLITQPAFQVAPYI